MKLWKIVACLFPITLGTSIAIGVQANHVGPRGGVTTINWERNGPCATCGHATPIVVTCDDGLDWQIYQPGTVREVASKVCPAGTHYTWKAMP